MGFESFFTTMIALVIGLVFCFGGYRLSMALLPLWGFFFGFALGAQTLQALLGVGFLASVTSWVVGFFVGAIFGLMAYLFYIVAVGIAAAGLGYYLGAGLIYLIGLDSFWVVWLVGIIAAVALVIVTYRFQLAKYVIIAATAIGGAGVIVITLMFGVIGMTLARFVENPVRLALNNHPVWTVVFLIMAIAGIAIQVAANRTIELEPYENRI